MANKMTYTQAIDKALEMINTAMSTDPNMFDGMTEAQERLEALKEQLAKRGSGKHGPTKTQRENEELKDRICEVLADVEEGLTATEVGDAVGVKCQKASALLKQLVDMERVNRVKNGKVVRFVLA